MPSTGNGRESGRSCWRRRVWRNRDRARDVTRADLEIRFAEDSHVVVRADLNVGANVVLSLRAFDSAPRQVSRARARLVFDDDGATALDELLGWRRPLYFDARNSGAVGLDELRGAVCGERETRWRAERERVGQGRVRRVGDINLVGHRPRVNRGRGFAQSHVDVKLRRIAVGSKVPLHHLENFRRPTELCVGDHDRVARANLHRL